MTNEDVEDGRAHVLQDKQIPDDVSIFRIHGPFLFGATDKLDLIAERIPSLPPIVVLRLRNMTAIDGTGLAALEQLADALHASGRELLLCGAREQPRTLMAQAEFHQHVGDANVCANVQDALERARVIYEARAAAAVAGAGRFARPARLVTLRFGRPPGAQRYRHTTVRCARPPTRRRHDRGIVTPNAASCRARLDVWC